MAPRKKKQTDTTFKVTLRPLSPKKKDTLEVLMVKGCNVEFMTGAVEGEYTHVEIRRLDGSTAFVVPAYRLVSIEDVSAVSVVPAVESKALKLV